MVTAVLTLVLSLLVMAYGVAWMFGGSKLAARFAIALGRGLGEIARRVGRWVGRLMMRYPRFVGTVIIIALLVLAVSGP